MGKPTDIRTIGSALYFLPVQTRVPLKFGAETLTHITCARVRVTVADAAGRTAQGWGETPLSVQWVWPGSAPYEERHEAIKQFTIELAKAWSSHAATGHPIELGHEFLETVLPGLLHGFNRRRRSTGAPTHPTIHSSNNPLTHPPTYPLSHAGESVRREEMPWLAALLCCSLFDIATHDAYGKLHGRPIYETYNAQFMNRDLAHFLSGAGAKCEVSGPDTSRLTPGTSLFKGNYPADYLAAKPAQQLVAWHLVGGLDPLDETELTGSEPDDGYPVTLEQWIGRDGLKCLKVKLRGNDAGWDYQRLVKVAAIGGARGVDWLSADFNCTVRDPEYVNAILDRLRDEQPRAWAMILYVEQPFPYELEQHALDVRSVSARKPLFLDESAHDWKLVRLGRELGWTGVALKTCKTQTGALLTACWARAHGMSLMVQDLTNPMLAQIPHALLAANVGTIMGVETNAMQFYPDASQAEARVHPGLYRRRDGAINMDTLHGAGFGYRIEEIQRPLPEPVAVHAD